MEHFLIFLIFFSCITNIKGNYVIIPFNSVVHIPNNDPKINLDFLSSIYYEQIYFNLTLANQNQIIKTFIGFSQYEFALIDENNILSSSNSLNFTKKVDFLDIINDYDLITATENFKFMTLSSDKDLNNFLHSEIQNRIQIEKENISVYKNIIFTYFNRSTEFQLRDNHSLLGLGIFRDYDIYPNFIYNLKKLNYINTSVFSFIFNKENNTDNLGYLVIGDEFNDIEYDIENSINANIKRNKYDWSLAVYNIKSYSKKENSSSFYKEDNDIRFKAENSYILGNQHYKEFIEKEFFNELVNKKVCEYKNISLNKIDKNITYYDTGTYICNGKSNIFLDYYNNKFPDLIFQSDLKFILTKEDLFIRNNKNPNDNNFYFIIFFRNDN